MIPNNETIHLVYLIMTLFVLWGCSNGEAGQGDMPETSADVQPAADHAPASSTATADKAGDATGKEADWTSGATMKAAQSQADGKQTASGQVAAGGAESADADRPYQLGDGRISANAVEGWKTYNGGGCGTCHGKGGIGAVGPNLADSVASKLSKEEFMDIVINGKSGTMMRPHRTNKRVMDNLEALYAYFAARGDGVLGPGNLIKHPLGKP